MEVFAASPNFGRTDCRNRVSSEP